MTIETRRLTLLPDAFAICKLAANAVIPTWATGSGFVSITRTAEELSIVCLQSLVPDGIKCEGHRRCFKLAGPIPFTTIGVLASLVAPLAEAGISVFALSLPQVPYFQDFSLMSWGNWIRTYGTRFGVALPWYWEGNTRHQQCYCPDATCTHCGNAANICRRFVEIGLTSHGPC